MNYGTLLVGQAPNQTSDPNNPLTGPIGRRLARLSGLSYEDYLSTYRRVNLLPEWPGAHPNGRGDKFPLSQARHKAFSLLDSCPAKVLMLGTNVATAFQLDDLPILTWDRVYIMRPKGSVFVEFATIPHPSHRSKWWLSKRNLRKAKAFLRELAEYSTVK